MKIMLSFAATMLIAAFAVGGVADTNGLKRMYVLDCGRLIAKDQSRWTPGVNVGRRPGFTVVVVTTLALGS